MTGSAGISFLRCFSIIGSKDPDALKIPARRAEYSLTESASSPVQAEPSHFDVLLHFHLKCMALAVRNNRSANLSAAL